MRKTLIAVAFAGAALAPAAALTTAATIATVGATVVAPAAAEAAPKAQLHRGDRLQRTPLVRRPNLIARRCFWPRVSIRREQFRLRHAGYRNVRYVGRTSYAPRCALFIHFTACRGARRYKVTVRYIQNRRFVIAQNRGLCFHRGPARRFTN